jgi:hypothetical protein
VRIGVIVDGQSEYASLGHIYDQITSASGHEMLRPLYAPMDPLAPANVIARSCRSRVTQLDARGVHIIVILLDRETRQDCCGGRANEIANAIGDMTQRDVISVIKNRTYENWLLADLNALRQQPARFQVTQALENRTMPDKADHVNGVQLLKQAIQSGEYDKVADSSRILQRADITTMSGNSRSFRRFLRVVGYPSFSRQSRRPLQ